MTALALTCWAVLAVALALLWVRQLKTRNATSVDVAWSGGLVFLAAVYPWFVEGDLARRVLVGVLGGVWALRLAWYLFTDRVLQAKEEDGRYRAMREALGPKANAFLFFFYQGQAAVAIVFSLPMLAAMRGGPLGSWDALGAIVWLVAVVGETLADRQLARFRGDPKNRGEVCRIGLWRYSRHPNYFFEWVHWWAYVAIGRAAPLTWIGPVAMLLFLFRLTGIPYTEQQALRSRGKRYREYQRTTSVFVPWFPRRET
jgi:steroid 5-alpha reductase family enzyme